MAGAASACFLLDMKGRVLIWRDYRGDVSAAQAERFFMKLIEREGDPASQYPVVHDNGITYLFIQHNNVYLMTASRQNCNAASLLLFLHRIVNYELLDEMMDFGYPQYTEAKILSEFIKTNGMPECKLGLNDRVLLEAQGRAAKGKAIDFDDIKFHQCVRLARFENDRTISFIPPDGTFDLMTYRLSTQVKPLIWVEAQVERHSRSRVEYSVRARSQYKDRSTATSVEIEIPGPTDIKYLKIIEKSGYQALPWVRYITVAGEYELRMI